MLEPCYGKLSGRVLRGVRGREAPDLPGRPKGDSVVGETNLSKLLSSMAPRVMEDEFVFCTVKDGSYGDYTELSPIATFCEAEGLTLVLPKYRADKAGFRYESVFKETKH
jgi:hypothetical protein